MLSPESIQVAVEEVERALRSSAYGSLWHEDSKVDSFSDVYLKAVAQNFMADLLHWCEAVGLNPKCILEESWEVYKLDKGE